MLEFNLLIFHEQYTQIDRKCESVKQKHITFIFRLCYWLVWCRRHHVEDFISIILKDDHIQLLCVYNLDGDDLKVHDKSRVDDLKEHVVHQGENYHRDFTLIFQKTTSILL